MRCTPFLVLILLATSGCVTQVALGEKDAVWVGQYGGLVHDVYYCVANKDADGKAYPVCYEAKDTNVKRRPIGKEPTE